MTHRFSATNAQTRLLSATIAALLVLAVVSAGMLLVGTAAAEETDDLEEVVNSTIKTTENTSYVEYDLVFAEEFETDEETVELTIYDDDETAVLEETVTGSPNETVTHEYTVGTDDDLEPDTEYRVLVEAENADHIASGYVEPDDEAIGGVTFGDDSMPGFGLGVGVAAVAIALAGLARVRGGGARVE